MNLEMQPIAVTALGCVGCHWPLNSGSNALCWGLTSTRNAGTAGPAKTALLGGNVRGSEGRQPHLRCSADPATLKDCGIFMTRADPGGHNRPDMTPLVKASETVGRAVPQGLW